MKIEDIEEKLIVAFDAMWDKVEPALDKISESMGESAIAIKNKYNAVKATVTLNISIWAWRIKYFYLVSKFILPLCLLTMIICYACREPLWGTVAGTVAVIIFFIAWQIPIFLLKGVKATIGNIPFAKEFIDKFTLEVRNGLKILLDFAFVTSFVSLFGTIFNLFGYSPQVLVISLAATLFFVVFAIRTEIIKFPWRQIMIGIIVVGLFYQGLFQIFPLRMKELTFPTGTKINGTREIIITPGAILYDEHFKEIGRVTSDSTVKLVDLYIDEKSEEIFCKIIFPIGKHQYRNGKLGLVPRQFTKEVITDNDDNHQIGNKQVSDKKGETNVTKKLPRPRIDGVSNRLVKKLGPGLYEITVYPDTTIATGIYIEDGTDYSVTSITPCEVLASNGVDGHTVNGFEEFTKRGSTNFDLTGVPGYGRGKATLKFKEKTLRNVSGKK